MFFFEKRYLVAFLTVLLFLPVMAQNRADLFDEAEYHFEAGEFAECVGIFQELLKKDTSNCNLNYKVGNSLFNIQGLKRESLPYFERAVKKTSERYREGSLSEKRAPIEALFYYAQVLLVFNRLEEAKENFEKFKALLDPLDVASVDYVNQLIKSCDNAAALQSKKIVFTAKAFPYPINSTDPVFKAVFNSDANFVIYLTKQNGKSVFLSSRKINDMWLDAVNITDQLSVTDRFELCSLSADGKRLYLVKVEANESSLYISTLEGDIWSACKKMSKPINSSYDQTFASESVDGKSLFFTSNRKGSIGGLDIYEAKLGSNGQWNSPVNLGKTINTALNEESPYLLADNNTLYFSSQGHYNMGGYDVFSSTQLSGSLWSEPQNIGFPLNTTDDDLSFYPSVEKGKAYYSDISSGKGVLVEVDTREKQEQVFNLIGKLAFADEASPVDKATVVLLNDKGDTLRTLSPSPQGAFQFQVNTGSYTLAFSANGYTSVQKNVQALENSQVADILIDATLNPVQVTSGEFVSIRSLFFDFNSDQLMRNDSTLLERIARVMLDYSMLAIEIEAHTDNKGDKLYNQRLSQKRANMVANYLISRGIDKTRIITIGVGDAIAIARNTNADGTDNPEGRKFNRRAELRLINAGKVRVVNEEIAIPENLRVVESHEYSICLAEKDTATIVDWPVSLDRKLISKIIKNDIAYYLYGSPTTKADAVAQLAKVAIVESDAFIIPQNYFKLQAIQNVVNEVEVYAIQVGAYKWKVSKNTFKSLGEIELYNGADGLIRYTFGKYGSLSQAATHLNKVKQKGFVDAFVVKLSKINDGGISSNSVSYTVQFFASFVHIDDKTFANLSAIKESKGSDGYYRYTVGVFDTFSEAKSYLLEVQQKGYGKAFVRRTGEISGY